MAAARRGAPGGRRGGARRGSARRGRRGKAPSSRPPREVESVEGGVRLNKLLADHGLASRRGADELIAEGHVFVDGVRVFELGLRVDPTQQRIELDGEPLEVEKIQRKQYYLLSKPPGVVCTNEKRETRPRAIDLIKDRAKGRIYTVGRLDEESKGLIILTNDGEFANRVMHPRYGVSKTYLVKLAGRISDADVQRVREGVRLADVRTVGARVLIKKRSRDYSQLEVTLHEGRNREIRRVFLSVGHKVVDLKRIRIGDLSDRKLKVGYWRHLTPHEVRDLVRLADGEQQAQEALPESTPDAPRRKVGAGRRRATRRRRRGR